MNNRQAFSRWFLISILVLCPVLLGCWESESRWDAAQQATQEGATAVSEAALDGAVFNKFFPAQTDGVDIVYKQEKDGFSQASLNRDGKLIAMLSISDTRNNPTAREKYQGSTVRIQGYPVVHRDKTTSMLVADRFQVQVQSEGDALTEEDRMKWLEKFDLGGLANAF
ncbi:hypothetical protein C5Y96_26110 [Blastopirellula marina]|uniref:Uncharacterized protein n=1 Tax=Blastopirellula marina TaxID=124 RepID=A0A2S8EZC8_9BACT|nr:MULTISPECIES: hypothetical protein [Pirellulaceae]PQO24984.1 hypothetical protein C5Y96_26110 [Blastopirellula marina]RCS40836.1 hypothetical protein DTL36_26160 [Bremerella cremea]